MSYEKLTRTISALAVICLLTINLYPLYINMHILLGTPVEHAGHYALNLATILFVCLIPLLYDIFRNTKVMFFVFLISIVLIVSSLYTYIDYMHILSLEHALYHGIIFETIAIIILSLALPLFSTVWYRHIQICYRIVTSAVLICFSYFTYMFITGHYLDGMLKSATHLDTLQVVLVLLALCWAVARSWNQSTFSQKDQENGINKGKSAGKTAPSAM